MFCRGWVRSGDVGLSHRLKAILFCAWGRERSGEEHQGVPGSPALSLRLPARLLRTGGACALSCLPDRWAVPSHLNSAHIYKMLLWYFLIFLVLLLFYNQIITIVFEMHCCWVTAFPFLRLCGLINCLKTHKMESGRQLNMCSTICVRCWIRKSEASAATVMISLFQSCGGF